MKKRILMMMTVVMTGACLVVGCSGDKEKESGSQEIQQSQDQESGAVTEGMGQQEPGAVTEGMGQQESDTATEGAEQQESSAAEEDVQVSKMTGTLDEVKDFMFVITDETGVSYAFTFEQKPQGLDKLSLGDKIVVTYTGTVSVVDAFLGEIISVEKVL